MLTTISLGWGRQSTTLAFMAAFGDLPMPDVVIHSDTTHERTATYDYAKRWTPFLEERGVKIVTVRPARTLALESKNVKSVNIPAFSLSDGVHGNGVLRRQCTHLWKIAPMRQWLQKNRNNEPVEMWLGISIDEIERQKPSDVKYITNRFPLLELRMTVRDCENYLRNHGIEVPVKSSCVFCPFHNKSAWRNLRETGNGDWDHAIQVDEAIRNARPGFKLFVHSARKPLKEIGDSVDAQPELMFNDECSGVCFL